MPRSGSVGHPVQLAAVEPFDWVDVLPQDWPPTSAPAVHIAALWDSWNRHQRES